jgi:hypothetical protein
MKLENKVYYHDEDIAFILVVKTEHAVRVISERMNVGFDEALEDFVHSTTHEALQNPETLLWTESAEFIADEYEREIEHTGV